MAPTGMIHKNHSTPCYCCCFFLWDDPVLLQLGDTVAGIGTCTAKAEVKKKKLRVKAITNGEPSPHNAGLAYRHLWACFSTSKSTIEFPPFCYVVRSARSVESISSSAIRMVISKFNYCAEKLGSNRLAMWMTVTVQWPYEAQVWPNVSSLLTIVIYIFWTKMRGIKRKLRD